MAVIFEETGAEDFRTLRIIRQNIFAEDDKILRCRPLIRIRQAQAFRNVVFNMPMVRAFWVIIRANSASDGARDSAIVTATSFADFVTMAPIASSTLMVSPSESSFVGDCEAA